VASFEPLAERVGFEPTVPLRGTHALQACRFNQLSHLSVQCPPPSPPRIGPFNRLGSYENGGGGRGIRTPEEPFRPLIDFESIAFVHSAIPPRQLGQQVHPRARRRPTASRNRLEVFGLMPPTRSSWGVEMPLSAVTMGHRMTRPGGVEPPASSSAGKRSIHLSYGRSSILAERLGFEPRVDLSGLHALSRRAPSTARPPLLNIRPCRQDASDIDARRARDSNPHEPHGPVDFKSTALPVRTSPPNLWIHGKDTRLMLTDRYSARKIYPDQTVPKYFGGVILAALLALVNLSFSRSHSARALSMLCGAEPPMERIYCPLVVPLRFIVKA